MSTLMMVRHPCGRIWGRPFTARKDLLARGLLCRRPNRSVDVRSADDSALEVAKLKGDIAEAERRLEALFKGGGPMPRAGAVTTLRQEVCEMKAKLAVLVGDDSSETAHAGDEKLAEHARQAFLEVEQLVSQERGSISESHEGSDITLLEAENERLRRVAAELLHRQSQLEELADMHTPLPLVLEETNGAGDFMPTR